MELRLHSMKRPTWRFLAGYMDPEHGFFFGMPRWLRISISVLASLYLLGSWESVCMGTGNVEQSTVWGVFYVTKIQSLPAVYI